MLCSLFSVCVCVCSLNVFDVVALCRVPNNRHAFFGEVCERHRAEVVASVVVTITLSGLNVHESPELRVEVPPQLTLQFGGGSLQVSNVLLTILCECVHDVFSLSLCVCDVCIAKRPIAQTLRDTPAHPEQWRRGGVCTRCTSHARRLSRCQREQSSARAFACSSSVVDRLRSDQIGSGRSVVVIAGPFAAWAFARDDRSRHPSSLSSS